MLTLLGGGPTHFRHLNQSLKRAPILVCADGGADVALSQGLTPAAVIGDLDSLSAEGRAAIPAENLHHIAEQDSTDFEKCLRSVEARAILAHGFLGGRLDHQLAALSALARFPEQRCVLIGAEDICFLAPPTIDLDLPRGTRLSLYPLAPVTGRSDGLEYPIEGLEFAPGSQIGTSNTSIGPVRLRFDAPAMLVIVPVAQLSAVLGGLVRDH
ncbi:thiamine pyrophosphokinase [Litoreibacter ponti]|uniref:Thiamine diphosphokinase n=2 Tax=Litoreibacter ponti TaxID=1510457 RepID=A0A2T6BK36_9RHOB|nr:thiamine pyrophosphokinase [Litoreibacter ponti]